VRITQLILAAAFGLALAACGGGGGSAAGTASSTPAASSGPTSTALQTSVPAATYAAASAEAAAYRVLNQERERCGVGLLAQSAELDTSAAGHTNYLVLRMLDGQIGTHDETPGLTGFVAVKVWDRTQLAGYKGAYIGEDIAYTAPDLANDVTGERLIRGLLATVYHQASLLDGFRDVGLSVGFPDKAPTATRVRVITVDLGHQTSAGKQEPSGLVTYPCEGTTGIQPAMPGEIPDPFTSLGFSAGPNVGHPLEVRGTTGTTVKLTSASLVSGAKTVPVTLYHVSDDKNGLLDPNQAFVIPREPLAVSTTYQATVTGTMDGVAFSRSFSFSTRSTP
jgi:uncharacterized protein YkwD